MGYITTRKERIQAALTKVQAAIAALYDSYTELSATENKAYSFDSGEGSQRATRRDTDKILDEIERLEAKERSLINDLYGMGIISVRLRRKRSCLRR